MREGALAGGLCLFHGEFLFFCDVVLSSDVNLQDTRKSPMGMEVPRGKRKARMCARVRPSSNDSATPRPSGGPQLLFPFALLGQFFTQRARWCPEATDRTDERCGTAGHTSVSAPLQTLGFLSAHLLGGHGL